MTETKMQLEDWLDDLCVRFIVNLPREELESVERICFQVEEAQWFYEDFIRPLDPALPSLSLKPFALRIFQHCPLMSKWSRHHHLTAFSEFLAYKTRVPVRGAILLNQSMDEVVLVKGWRKGSCWGFPRGKINKDEKDLDCAIREVYEETGFDIEKAGLVQNEKDVKFIEITMREQHMKLYVFRGVPRDTYFEPRTRKEISRIEWYKLSDLPTLKKNKQNDQGFVIASANKFYMVAPFMSSLKKWIAQQKKMDLKTPAEIKQALQEGREIPMGEVFQSNGGNLTSWQHHVGTTDSSYLPDVVSSRDASDHLKKLLNIGCDAMSLGAVSAADPTATPSFDADKSSALLRLLRNGGSHRAAELSGDSMPHMETDRLPSPVAQPYFPGFPQQSLSARVTNNSRQGSFYHYSPSFHHGIPLNDATSFNINVQRGPLDQPVPIGLSDRQTGQVSQDYLSQGIPHHQGASTNSEAYTSTALKSYALAPFQRTGDPQFSFQGQPSPAHGTAVPRASNLPAPKLTNHSLALLSVFKHKAAREADTSTIPEEKRQGNESVERRQRQRQPSQHQDRLLSLLRGTNISAQAPAKLSTQSVPQSEKQILQCPQAETSAERDQADIRNLSTSQGRILATAPRPLNISQCEIEKAPIRKRANINRKANKDQRAKTSQVPVTILPRPQVTKKEPPSTQEAVHTIESLHPRREAAGTQKPFHPKILRRPEGLQSGETHPMPAKREEDLEIAAEPNSDRRQSQTAEQKEMLLSLFDKQISRVNHSATEPFCLASKPPDPTNITPFSFMNDQTSDKQNGDAGEPSGNRSASPANKAFLLGFLEGVAKGNK